MFTNGQGIIKKMGVNVGTIEATIDGMPTYDRFAEELSVTDKVRPDLSDNALLQVACKKCDKFFNPSYTATRNRISAISKDGHGESNFYCSDECKDACSIFNKHLFQADHPNKPQLVERPYQSAGYHGFGGRDRYPPRDAEIKRFCNQFVW